MMGQAVALYQTLTALVGLELVYMGIRSAIEVSGSPLVSRSSGIIRNAGVPAVGFILGGLMLSSMPPSANFLSKYIAATLYSGQPVAAVLIGLGALANLAAFLRITRRVFFGPPTSEARKGFGFEEALVLLFVIVNILAISIAGYFLEAAGMAGG
jgi:NADH:ubiquinone oxidoreductase subunit 5 (subunit L)/multisubunit Na+/H+ antiporter MnhA subunit